MKRSSLSGAAACALAAERAIQAMEIWREQLTEQEMVEVTRLLGRRQAWLARRLWIEVVTKKEPSL